MLYDPNKPFTEQEFQNPGKEYRGTPFWAWNAALDRQELLRQIGCLKQMGFGGFHMHVRYGLITPYMSKEFLDLIESCVDEAEKKDMLAWLYDEDTWPSGFAGGMVTREHPEFRRRWLRFAPSPISDCAYDVGRFDVCLNSDGTLASYRLLADGEQPAGAEWFAQVVLESPSQRFNNATYVDTLNPRAIEAFISCSYDSYRRRLGSRFGGTIPSIFTDEPQFAKLMPLPFSDSRTEARVVWTDDLPGTYAAAYNGEDLVAHLPELFWNLPDNRPSVIRYHFHDHVTERFVSAFSDTVGKWCRDAGILYAGHVMSEPTLRSQSHAVGEAMRFYRSMTLPGIDMLCGAHELTTAKQAQSAVRQYGRCGMLSELYGVLGWDLDFRGHKHHGDWQAALGVTVRVPHLSHYSMGGGAKRDYPQSIHYQSCWYQKYPLIENHFARLNTVLTRGRARVRIGVIHPIESYWLHLGAQDTNSTASEQLESSFASVTEWLCFSGMDFDYISESLLPSLCPAGANPLPVGKQCYDAVVVPECETLRSSTLERLEAFRAQGGTLIFMGEPPACADALPSSRPAGLAARSTHISASRAALLDALEPFRELYLLTSAGALAGNYLSQMRDIDGERWLFLANGVLPGKPDVPQASELRLKLKGSYSIRVYDTVTGKISALPCSVRNGWTDCRVTLYEYDSLLLRLTPADAAEMPSAQPQKAAAPVAALPVPAQVPFRLGEPNALMLDKAEFRLDDGPWEPDQEMLRLNSLLHRRLGWHSSGAQPYCQPDIPSDHRVTLRMTVQSEIDCAGIELALEHPETASIRWNGQPVPVQPNGYYVDHAIRRVPLPPLKAGKNLLELEVPLEIRIPLEWCYLLGPFGVKVSGSCKTVVALPSTLGFGSITTQGLPFYSGPLTYLLPVHLPQAGRVRLHVPQFRAAVLELKADCEEAGSLIAFSPYTACTGLLPAGDHTLELTAYLNRTNTFGPVHNADRKETWLGPNVWYTSGDRWTDGYELAEEGVLNAPCLELVE